MRIYLVSVIQLPCR